MPTTSEVFGIRTEPVLSYVERVAVDDKFKQAVATDHHIVVYGSSKQGKTSLRQKYLLPEQCAIIRCAPNMQSKGIYNSLVRQTNIRIETFTTATDSVGGKITSKLGFKAWIPFLGGLDTEVGGEVSGQKQEVLTKEFVAFDFGEAQSVGEILLHAGFRKFVILENFHYLPIETQKQLSFDLKTFHEIGIRFIVLGIWREANLLTTHNGDLQDRIIEIPVEPWSEDDFKRVVKKGSELLHIRINDDIIAKFIENSYGNIGLLQEFLRTFCERYGVNETKDEEWSLDDAQIANVALKAKLDEQRGHTLKDLQSIAARSRIRSKEDDPLLLPYYLVLVILRTSIEELKTGLERNRLLELLRSVHRRDDKETIRGGDLTHLLVRLPALQSDIQPPFLYYDSNSRRLRVVDTRQFFVLANVNRNELEEEIPFPTDIESAGDEPGFATF